MRTEIIDSVETDALRKLESVFSQLDPRREQKVLFARLLSVVEKLILNAAPTLSLTNEMKAADDIDFFLNVLSDSIGQYPLTSKRHLLRLRGQLAFRQQIEEAGGTYSGQEVADLLGVKSDAIRKRRAKGQLIAISQGEHFAYPAFQFNQSGVVEHLPELLKILNVESPVDLVRFFLTTDDNLGDTPINVLEKGTNNNGVFLAAKQFGHQVAR